MSNVTTMISTRDELNALVADGGPFYECKLQCRDGGERYYGSGGLIIAYHGYKTIVHESKPDAGYARVDETCKFNPADFDWYSQ